MASNFIPAKINQGDRFRVKQTFYASSVAVPAGMIVRVDWANTLVDPDARRYELTICLTPIDPPGKSILWGRSHPLEQSYLDEIFERVT